MTATEISALVRACNPWNKGAPCLYKGQQLNILLAQSVDMSADFSLSASPGQFITHEGKIFAGCAEGSLLQIHAVYWQESFWYEGWL
jgi:methionyl-tRNA formyltransferase